MNLLAVETSGFEASIALWGNDGLQETRHLSKEGRRHAQTLVLSVDELLKAHDLKPADIDVVAASVGPGSFTGLRVGVVFAKTFAWANSAKLVAVDTLHALAQRLPSPDQAIAAVSDAQRQEVFFNRFEFVEGERTCRPLAETTIVPVADIVADNDANLLWTGPGVDRFADAFSNAKVADEEFRNPSAETVAVLAAQMATAENFANPDLLEPIYIRRSYAEENAARS